jgi:hypothetical protein
VVTGFEIEVAGQRFELLAMGYFVKGHTPRRFGEQTNDFLDLGRGNFHTKPFRSANFQVIGRAMRGNGSISSFTI